MIMTANELRIGDVIGWAHEESVSEHIVTVKDIADIEYIENNPHDPEERFARGIWWVPIPLTSEWLIRLGFKKEVREDYGGDEFTVYHNNGIDIHDLEGRGGGFAYATYVKGDGRFKGGFLMECVHQVQNLYQSLTNQELTKNGLLDGK